MTIDVPIRLPTFEEGFSPDPGGVGILIDPIPELWDRINIVFNEEHGPDSPDSEESVSSGTAGSQVSLDEILQNPAILEGKSPGAVRASLGKLPPGWIEETLGAGAHRGQGWMFRQYTEEGNPTGRYIRWHRVVATMDRPHTGGSPTALPNRM
ncbi:MAG TPA: hypothetical protein VFD49_00070 [Candidatus Dormibacteraeota bacterium]|nr:hypothetical protein [Candidatus Dormibacteraeota bacterium]